MIFSNKRVYQAFQRFFSTEDGKIILNSLIVHSQYDRLSFDKDPVTMAFKEGRKSPIHFIFNTLKLDPNEIEEKTKQIKREETYYNE